MLSHHLVSQPTVKNRYIAVLDHLLSNVFVTCVYVWRLIRLAIYAYVQSMPFIYVDCDVFAASSDLLKNALETLP